VLCMTGEIDDFNADRVAQVVRRYARLKAPLVVDLGELDFLSLAGFRVLLTLDQEHRRAGLHFSIVTGRAMRALTQVFPDTGLMIVASVPEALRLIDAAIRERRRFLSSVAGQREPRRR
jgi:anti-anti-sigma factor